jgi:hypothetical protein
MTERERLLAEIDALEDDIEMRKDRLARMTSELAELDKRGWWHFQCPVCEYSDDEAGGLVRDEHFCCILCWTDNRRLVECRTWRDGDDPK